MDIKAERESLGMTQAEFAAAVRVTTNTVARWERGEVAYPPMLEIVVAALKGSAIQFPVRLSSKACARIKRIALMLNYIAEREEKKS